MYRCGLAIALLFAWIGLAPAAGGAGREPAALGQWIWSSRDQALFLEARREFPSLLPGIWVATLAYRDGEIRQGLARSPSPELRTPIAAVLRFDVSLHQAWDHGTTEEIARAVDGRVAELLQRIRGTGAELAEVQLDYDCPVRRLPQWSEVVTYLAKHALRGQTLWITSLIAQLQAPRFGDLFRDSVAGHIVQVFDTGEAIDQYPPETLAALLSRQGLPFRLGVGAFERQTGATTVSEHRAWFSALPVFASNPWYRGLWIFPGGRPWLAFLPKLEGNP